MLSNQPANKQTLNYVQVKGNKCLYYFKKSVEESFVFLTKVNKDKKEQWKKQFWF